MYFSVAHDPTEVNRQDPDRGTQYRSAIFSADPAQKATAGPISPSSTPPSVTEEDRTQVASLEAFYPAEAHHQDYLTLHPDQGYIARFDLPKIANLKAMYPQQFRAEPALVMARAGKAS